VGLKGSRVQSIVRELGGERIDIVPWSADSGVFVSRALQPARVQDVRVQEADKRMLVVVADDQLSLAIGKGGQNARLAAKLTGWKIDLVSRTEQKKREELEKANRVEVESLGLGEATTEKLISGGIETVQELLATPFEKLVEIPGIGDKTAERIQAAAREYLLEHPPVVAEAPPQEMEFTPEMEASPAAEPADAEPADRPGESGGTEGETR
jgi:N utilization substance protein A